MKKKIIVVFLLVAIALMGAQCTPGNVKYVNSEESLETVLADFNGNPQQTINKLQRMCNHNAFNTTTGWTRVDYTQFQKSPAGFEMGCDQPSEFINTECKSYIWDEGTLVSSTLWSVKGINTTQKQYEYADRYPIYWYDGSECIELSQLTVSWNAIKNNGLMYLFFKTGK